MKLYELGFASAILPELTLAEVLAFARGERFSSDEVNAPAARFGVSLSALGDYPNRAQFMSVLMEIGYGGPISS